MTIASIPLPADDDAIVKLSLYFRGGSVMVAYCPRSVALEQLEGCRGRWVIDPMTQMVSFATVDTEGKTVLNRTFKTSEVIGVTVDPAPEPDKLDRKLKTLLVKSLEQGDEWKYNNQEE